MKAQLFQNKAFWVQFWILLWQFSKNVHWEILFQKAGKNSRLKSKQFFFLVQEKHFLSKCCSEEFRLKVCFSSKEFLKKKLDNFFFFWRRKKCKSSSVFCDVIASSQFIFKRLSIKMRRKILRLNFLWC